MLCDSLLPMLRLCAAFERPCPFKFFLISLQVTICKCFGFKIGIEDLPVKCFYSILMIALIWQCLEGFENNLYLRGFRQSCILKDIVGLPFP